MLEFQDVFAVVRLTFFDIWIDISFSFCSLRAGMIDFQPQTWDGAPFDPARLCHQSTCHLAGSGWDTAGWPARSIFVIFLTPTCLPTCLALPCLALALPACLSVCLSVCLSLSLYNIYICIYIYIFIYIHIHTHIHTYIHTYITLHYIRLDYITLHYIHTCVEDPKGRFGFLQVSTIKGAFFRTATCWIIPRWRLVPGLSGTLQLERLRFGLRRHQRDALVLLGLLHRWVCMVGGSTFQAGELL